MVCKNHAWERMPNKVRKSCPKQMDTLKIAGRSSWNTRELYVGSTVSDFGAKCSNYENIHTRSTKLRLQCKKLLLTKASDMTLAHHPLWPLPLFPSCPISVFLWYYAHLIHSRVTHVNLELRFWDGGEGHLFWISCPWSGTVPYLVSPFPAGEYWSELVSGRQLDDFQGGGPSRAPEDPGRRRSCGGGKGYMVNACGLKLRLVSLS